jgi:hypothetical protein
MQERETEMIRLIILALLGYGAYRLARHFVRSVPGDFEPILLAPPQPKPARVRAKGGGRK